MNLLTKTMTNSLSDTKGASQALTHHSDQSLIIALSSCLLKQLSSIELLSKQVLFLCIVCSRLVQASRPGNLNSVLNIHELYLPPHYHLICPPEAHQLLSLGQLFPTYPPEVCLTPSLGLYACPYGSLTCVPATPWHSASVSRMITVTALWAVLLSFHIVLMQFLLLYYYKYSLMHAHLSCTIYYTI